MGIWQGTSGFSEPALSNSVLPYMRFSLGSITKTYCTALIMQLAEEGKLSLADPISNWLPTYTNLTNTITVRQLLNHTSCLLAHISEITFRASSPTPTNK